MMNRRQSIGSLAGGAAAAALAAVFAEGARAAEAGAGRHGKFRHSVCRWCFNRIPFDEFCRSAKKMGIESVELLAPKEWELARGHGMSCAMGMIPPRNGIGGIQKGFNRVEHHDVLFDLFSESIEQAAKAGVPNIVIFSGNRGGMDLETGLKNCAEGVKRLMPVAEKHGVTLAMELLNSKVDHQDYMCDHTEWGAALVDAVGSERFKLLYDIYHMQIMEGDVIATFRKHRNRICHYHTAGVPGRNEIGDSQELNYRGIAKALAEIGYTGFLAQEFIPKNNDPLASLQEAVEICRV
jgi:hydroxypyruvate isomerase